MASILRPLRVLKSSFERARSGMERSAFKARIRGDPAPRVRGWVKG